MAYQNNNENRQNVTTKGYHTSNANAIKVSAFEWDYTGDMMKIIITDELPENERTEKRRYDYEHSWLTFITRLKCLDLYNQIKAIVLPAMVEQKNAFVSITLAEVNQFGVGVIFDETKRCRTYAKLIRNIDPQNLTSTTEISYEFRKGETIVNYDNTTGKFENRILAETEMMLLVKDLDNFVNASGKAYNHADRVVDKSYKDMVVNMLKAIGTKVGADMPVYNSAQRAGAKYGQAPLFGGDTTPAPSDTIHSLDELEIPFD